MTQAPGEEQDITKLAQEQEEDGKDKEVKKSSKLIPYLTTVTRSVTKFKKFPLENTPASSSPPNMSDSKYSDSLEGSFGLGPLVFPAFQRFNNIGFFLFLFFMVVLAHGKLEK